jgi:ATP-binding cassette subfamily B protein
VLGAYALLSALLALAVPIAVQALVNSVAARVVQPLVVLSLVALLGTGAVGLLAVLQLSLVERLQQRVLTRLALRMARRMIESAPAALEGRYAPELANRFFDVLTVQKMLAKLLLDGIGAAISAAIGFILLAFYDRSGLLSGFDALLLGLMIFFVFPLGIGGLRTSIDESGAKYRLASWLEELARCQTSFKLHGAPAYLLRRAEGFVAAWLEMRRKHFAVTLRQEAVNQLFQSLAAVGVLAIGGWLVVRQEITLGQLVAAQLIVAQVLKAVEKLLRQAETVYDLLTGLDKTGYLTDLTPERSGGAPLPEAPPEGASVRIDNIRFTYGDGRDVLQGLSLELAPGERVSLVGESGAGKSTLAALLCGLYEPQAGGITINGCDLHSTDLTSLRQHVTLVGGENALFDGTVEENIVVGRSYLSGEEIARALRLACLDTELASFSEGLRTHVLPGGSNLSGGQAQRLLLARAVADRPSLLILDEAFSALDERTVQQLLDGLFAPENGWTIIDISHEGAIVERTERVCVLRDGRIIESGAPSVLARQEGSHFRWLFPALSERLGGGRS